MTSPIHPALPVLAGSIVAGVWGLRRWDPSFARAWGWVGLVGALLLAPALLQPGGIPSPAASLAAEAPWQAVSDPTDGNPVLRDVTYQIQPWLLFLRHELRAGRLPLWNPHQFAGAPFWANGQSAPLFPLHLLFVLLPLEMGFVLLPWLRFLVAGLGVWKLGRELGLEPPAALAAALAFPLSGMLVSFLLFPMGNALCLVPWVLWGVERLANGRSGLLPLAVAAGLQALGGHPETVIHTALLSGLYLLVRGVDPPGTPGRRLGTRLGTRPGTWLRFAGGWALAGALAAVHLVPLALNVLQSSKWHEAATGASLGWAEAGGVLLRLVLPQLYGHPAHGTWWGPFNYSATAVYLGALALPLACAGVGATFARRHGPGGADRRWVAVVTFTGVSLVIAYHLPGVYDLVHRIPVLGRIAHHRLIFGVELGGALLVGRGLDAWRRERGSRSLLAGAALVGALLAGAWIALGDDWAREGLVATQLRWTVWVAALTALLAAVVGLGSRLGPGARQRIAWAVPAVVALDLLLAHGAINPALPLARLYPETGAIERLRALGADAPAAPRLVGVGGALRPDAAVVYGFYDVRGDDPVKAARFEDLYRRLARGSAVYFQPVTRWDETLLDALAVRWVIGPPGSEPPGQEPRAGWRRVYDGPDARLWERPGALPRVRTSAGSPVAVSRAEPGRWELELGPSLTSPREVELVVAEIWDAGWRARLKGPEGRDSGGAVRPTEEGWMAVTVPAGTRRVVLRYRAPGLALGASVSLGAWVLGLGAAVVSARRRRSAIIPSG